MTYSAWDWRARLAEVRKADGFEAAETRRYGDATKRLLADLPKVAKRMSTRQISTEYGVSQQYVQRLLRRMRK